MMNKIPVFDIGDTLLPSKKEINQTVKRKLNQQGLREVPDFPIYEYNIFKPEDVQEWLDENDIDADAEKLSLAYQGGARRYLKRKSVIDTLRQLGEEHGPIGFITDNSVEAKEFFETVFQVEEDEEELEDVNYEGFVVSEEVGADKPNPEVFEAFLEQRDEPAEKFVYFGNNPEYDKAAEDVGMHFVWVKRYNTFDSEWDGISMGAVTVSNVENALQRIEEQEQEE